MTGAEPISPGIWRLRAGNASPLTGTGTNTYLMGSTDVAVIDPGPDLDAHLDAILAAVRGRRVTAIVVTHAHRDHSGLARRLATETKAPVLAFGGARDGISPRMAALPDLEPSGEGLDHAFQPDRRLADADRLAGPDWTLRVLHTPGHLGGHLCLAEGRRLFSGDHVMGWATSIVSPPEGDMGDYMASLDRLGQERWDIALPGHGDPVPDCAARIAELVAHRRMREAQVLAAVAAAPDTAPATAATIAACVYHDIDPVLLPAATRNVLAHLLDLAWRNRVVADLAPGPDAQWHSA